MNYQTMVNTRPRLIILDEWVNMAWARASKQRYIRLGYVYTTLGDTFLCKVEDLPHGSHAEINVLCSICEQPRVVSYKNLMKSGHSMCRDCLGIADLSGLTFGRLRVLGLDKNYPRGAGAYWLCECECGTVISVKSGSLTRKNTSSCGCYKIDRLESHRGENSPNWRHEKTHEERLIGRNYTEYHQWVKAVMRRDNYTCQICGRESRDSLEAHHLYSYTAYPEFQLQVSNGISICKGEHKEFHIWMGGYKVPCVPADLDRWLYETSCIKVK